MSENILILEEQLLKKTIVKEYNHFIISGKNGKLNIYLNQYIPKNSDFIFHPIKYWQFKKNNKSFFKTINSQDCSSILIDRIKQLDIRRFSVEHIWNIICTDIINSKNFQYSFTDKKCCTFIMSYCFIIKN